MGDIFNTGFNTNPFDSFRARNSIFHDTLADISEYIDRSITTVGDIFYRTLDRTYAMTVSILPQYNWNLIGRANRVADIDGLLSRVFEASAGRIYIAVYVRHNVTGTGFGVHAMVLLRTNNGVIAIPTNIRTTQEFFAQSLAPTTNVSELHVALSMAGIINQSRELLGIGIFEASAMYSNDLLLLFLFVIARVRVRIEEEMDYFLYQNYLINA